MQVAVAAAHPAGLRTAIEQFGMFRKSRPHRAMEALQFALIEDSALREPGFVDVEHIRHARRSALRPVDGRNTMEMLDLARRLIHHLRREPARERGPVEQAILL